MAPLRAILIAMTVAAAVVPASAADHFVGDNAGWNLGVEYDAWAERQDFHVGDSITFMYTRGEHNVIMVNEREFQGCTYSNATSKIWSSGFDVLPLVSPGKQGYISGMEGDCSRTGGMKLAITVFGAEEPASAPILGSSAPPPAASTAPELGVSPIKSFLSWLLALQIGWLCLN